MKITFTTDHKVQQHDGNGPHYKAGETYDLHFSYAEKYKNRGLAVDFDGKAERARKQQQDQADVDRKAADDAAALAAKLDARGKIIIPDDLSGLDFSSLRDLAQSVSDQTIKSKDDALKAIEAEKVRRNPT